MVEALLGLGGNVGDVRKTLDRAVTLLSDRDEVRLLAAIVRLSNSALGGCESAAVHQSLHRRRYRLTPHHLLARAQAVERALGRERAKEERWGPRPIDIDLLAYDDLALQEPDLTLPHPRLFARAFVLAPLAEIAPERVIAGVRVREALAQLDASGIERLAPAENQG